MTAAVPPSDRPIAQLLRDAGDAAGTQHLPTEGPNDPAGFGFGFGSMEGVLSHHGRELAEPIGGQTKSNRGSVGPEAGSRLPLLMAIRRLSETGAEVDRRALYALARGDALLRSIDEVLELLMAEPERWPRLESEARWLVDESRHRGPAKLGIALLGVVGDGRDVDRIRLFAQHGEFTLYGVVALARLVDDPVDELWSLAKRVTGWGKIHTVERLAQRAANRPEIQRWLLIEGWTRVILDQYLAYPCAVGGDLAGALEGDADDALIGAACSIMRALSSGGPVQSMRDYAAGPIAVDRLLDQLERRCDRLERLETLEVLRTWLIEDCDSVGPGERWEHRDAIVERCNAIFAWPSWPPLVVKTFERDGPRDEWLALRVASAVGVDLWEQTLARLSLDARGQERVRWLRRDAKDDERRDRLAAWAVATLPFEEIAAADMSVLGHRYGPPTGLANACVIGRELLRPEPEWHGRVPHALLRAALECAHPSMRIAAANVLASTPPELWGQGVLPIARRVAAEDERDDVLKAFEPLRLAHDA